MSERAILQLANKIANNEREVKFPAMKVTELGFLLRCVHEARSKQ